MTWLDVRAIIAWRQFIAGRFTQEGVEVRLGNIAPADIQEIVLEIAFGAQVANADGPGPDAISWDGQRRMDQWMDGCSAGRRDGPG